MDYSAANTALWNIIIQMGIIAAAVLTANLLRRRVGFIKKSLAPTAVLAGFLLLLLKSLGALRIDMELLEMLTYHGLAIGFIALSLRVPKRTEEEKGELVGVKSGALIVSTYLMQGILGLVISLALAYTFMPGLFKASGILLPMGYGQGPGQANNIGSSYEQLGFVGGRSFALSLAASGYLCACVVGVLYLNVLARRGKIKKQLPEELSGSVTIDTFQDSGEIPVSESVDKLSVQMALVILVYLLTYLVCAGLTDLVARFLPGALGTVNTLLWGFNFVVGSVIAILVRLGLKSLKKGRIMTRQYQNNYLLSRISGLAFDVMIVAGICSINIEDLTGLWVPFLLMAVSGGVATLFYLQWLCKRIYPDYYYEGLTSMYGMLTGTISSGVLLLRELDPNMDTPAANNLVLGSSFAIVFGAPMLVLISLAPRSDAMAFLVLGLLVAYLALLILFIFKARRKKRG